MLTERLSFRARSMHRPSCPQARHGYILLSAAAPARNDSSGGKHQVTIRSHSLVLLKPFVQFAEYRKHAQWAHGIVTVAVSRPNVEALSDTLTCRVVDEWFREDNERRSVVLERPDGSAKLVNRSAFYQTLLGPMGFGWALYAKEPAVLFPAPAGLTVEGHLLAVDAAMQ